MPFFSRDTGPEPEPVRQAPMHEEPPRHGFFSRNRSTSPSPSHQTSTTSSTSYTSTTEGRRGHGSGIFRRSTNASRDGSVHSNTGMAHKPSLLRRTFGHSNGDVEVDPSIVAARERVLSAEQAEQDADRALEEARRSVREARDHVRRLELEAKEEARRAKIKQFHVREVSKRAKPLGRRLDL